MSKLDDYRGFVKSARSRLGYWKSYSLIQFTSSIARLMKAERVSGRQLASRLGSSPAHVSKILSGNENVTIETMARFAAALDAVVHVHVAKKGVSVRWVEEASADAAAMTPLQLSATSTSASVHVALPEPALRHAGSAGRTVSSDWTVT